MRVTEVFTLGYGRSDDCYHSGHYGRCGYGKRYHHGGYDVRRYDDRDTPLARLKGSQL